MYLVNYSKEEEIDVELERIDVHPSSNLSASRSGNNDIISIEDSTTTEGVNNDATISGGSHGTTSVMSKLAFILVNKKTAAVICVVGICAILGVSIIGAAGHKKQQQNALALASINGIGGKSGKGKAGKSISFCEPAEVMTCGQTFTNEKVVLSDDLICMDDVDDASNQELKTMNAAIKVAGPDAIIDCKGHTIIQMTTKSAAACETPPLRDLNPSSERKSMKTDCDLYYQVGIFLVDGATAINCKVEQFYDGLLVVDGGEVKKAEVSGSRNGVRIRDQVATSSATKISDVYAHGNNRGIDARVNDSGAASIASIEDVLTERNLVQGMRLRGQGITVKDSTARYNGEDGIKIAGENPNSPTKVQFEGTVLSHHNKRYGIEVDEGKGAGTNKFAEVKVVGMLSTFLNLIGLNVQPDANMKNPNYVTGFTVEDGGSFSSCQNTNFDIKNKGNVNFVDGGTDGDGYTCDEATVAGSGIGIPSCVTCPACD